MNVTGPWSYQMALEDSRFWHHCIDQLQHKVADRCPQDAPFATAPEAIHQRSDIGSWQPEHTTVEPTMDLGLRGVLQVLCQTTFKPTEGPVAMPAVMAPAATNTDSAVSQPVVPKTPTPLLDLGSPGVMGASLRRSGCTHRCQTYLKDYTS